MDSNVNRFIGVAHTDIYTTNISSTKHQKQRIKGLRKNQAMKISLSQAQMVIQGRPSLHQLTKYVLSPYTQDNQQPIQTIIPVPLKLVRIMRHLGIN